MKIYYFYAERYQQAIDRLDSFTKFRMVYTGRDDLQYANALMNRWDVDDDIMVVEQDIEIHEDVIRSFELCQNVWCCFRYEYLPPGEYVAPLGCTRFRKEKTVRAEEIGTHPFRGFDPRYPGLSMAAMPSLAWYQLDMAVFAAMMAHGYRPCVHKPDVKHLRPIVKKPI